MAAGGGAPWAERARVVGTQIRNRFRVAPVDRRWLWRRADGSVATEAVRRWSDRVRTLLQRDRGADQSSTSTEAAAKPSSSALRFYRKKVGKEVDGIEDSLIFRSLQALAVPLIGNACYVFMHGLNSVQIHGAEKLHQALQERPKGKSLLTVSNHVAAMDDPFVIASLLPPSVMLAAQKLRWTLCATDRCFTNPVLSTFFRSVKVLPVSRGDGIYQKGMDMALSKLNSGGWVHIFPEGSRSRDGGKTVAPAKRGVGRLVMDADSLPVVIPFVHTGMQDIMPVGKRIPRAGKRVIVVVGDPINFDDLIIDNTDNTQHISRGILYDKATQRIGQRLQELKVEVDRLAAEQQSELQNRVVSDDGYRLWQQVDWEGFGIGSSMSSEPSGVQEPSKEAEPEMRLEVEQSISATPSEAIFSDIAVPHWFRRHVDPSELMGFAARGLIKNGKFLQEGYRKLQEPATLNTWWWSQANSAVTRWSTARLKPHPPFVHKLQTVLTDSNFSPGVSAPYNTKSYRGCKCHLCFRHFFGRKRHLPSTRWKWSKTPNVQHGSFERTSIHVLLIRDNTAGGGCQIFELLPRLHFISEHPAEQGVGDSSTPQAYARVHSASNFCKCCPKLSRDKLTIHDCNHLFISLTFFQQLS